MARGTRNCVLSADKFPEALGQLFTLGDRVVAPTKAPRGDIFFREVSSPAEIELCYGNSQVSPTEHLRPPKEVYFEYQLKDDGPPELTPPPPPSPFILFGIRPCDVAAVQYLDHFFLQREPADELYGRRRKVATLIAMACAEPAAETCFCPCCEGGGPVSDGGYDVQLTPVGEQYLVEFATEKGERIRRQWESLLAPATPEVIKARDAQKKKAIEELFELHANLAAAVRRVSARTVNMATWQEIARHCYSCGACSYLCPVCTCFDVNELKYDEKSGARIRQMDSCRLFGYPREAAGGVRGFATPYRARMYSYHKLGYEHFKERGRHGCVGCGRCIIACLGHMGMPTVCELVRRPPTEATS